MKPTTTKSLLNFHNFDLFPLFRTADGAVQFQNNPLIRVRLTRQNFIKLNGCLLDVGDEVVVRLASPTALALAQEQFNESAWLFALADGRFAASLLWPSRRRWFGLFGPLQFEPVLLDDSRETFKNSRIVGQVVGRTRYFGDKEHEKAVDDPVPDSPPSPSDGTALIIPFPNPDR
jgi:hypothetical protein